MTTSCKFVLDDRALIPDPERFRKFTECDIPDFLESGFDKQLAKAYPSVDFINGQTFVGISCRALISSSVFIINVIIPHAVLDFCKGIMCASSVHRKLPASSKIESKLN